MLTAPSGTATTTVLEVVGDPQGDGSLVSDLTVRIPSNTNATGDIGILSGAVSNVRVVLRLERARSGANRSGSRWSDPGGVDAQQRHRNGRRQHHLLRGAEAEGSTATPTTISDSRVTAPIAILAAGQATTVRPRPDSRAEGSASSPAMLWSRSEDSLIRLTV